MNDISFHFNIPLYKQSLYLSVCIESYKLHNCREFLLLRNIGKNVINIFDNKFNLEKVLHLVGKDSCIVGIISIQ